MTSYQKLKQKCEYLQSQVDIFKNALTVVRQDPQVVEDFSQDSISLTMRTLYSIRENEINEELKRRLNHWVAFNLDKEAIERLLKLKEANNKMNANEFAKQLEEKLDCVVLHTQIRDCGDDDDDEMFIVLSPSASRVKLSFIVDLMSNFVYNLNIQETSYYELDKYLKTINEIVERRE